MSESVEARMIASLEANIRDYQKKMDKALGVSKKTFGGINDNAKNVEKQITKAMGNSAQVISTLHGPLGGVASRFSSFGSTISRVGLLAGVSATALGALTFSATIAIKAFQAFETQQLTTEQIIRSTGGAANRSADDIEKLAQNIALVTLASRQGAREAANQLLTFKSISGDTFDRTLRAAQDLASVGFGTITSAAVQLGKALENPVQGISQLREVGVSFSAQQRKMIQNFVDMGDVAAAQNEILKAVEGQVGGAGAAQGGGLDGAFDTLYETTGIVLEQWGETISKAIKLKEGILQVADAVATLRKEQEKSALADFKPDDFTGVIAERVRGGNADQPLTFDDMLGQEARKRTEALAAQKKVLDDFLATETERASRTKEQIALEREMDAITKRAREEGVTLTKEQVEEQAKLNIMRATESGAIKKTEDEFSKKAESVRDQIRMLELQAEIMGGLTDTTLSYNDAAEKTRIISELIVAAQKEGVTITDEMRAKIDELAQAQVDANTHLEEAQKKYKDTAEALKEVDQVGADSLKGLASDLASGEDAAESLQRALRRVGDSLIDIGLNTAFESLKGSSGKSGGGIFDGIKSLFGFRADGGSVEKGKPYIVGERRPELFVPNSAGRIVPRVPQQGGNTGGGTVVNITTPPGATVEQQRSRRGNQDIVDIVVKRTGATYGLKKPSTST